MKNILIYLALLMLSLATKGQENNLNYCNCIKDFEYVIKSTRENYVAYKDKIAGKEQEFLLFTDSVRTLALHETRTAACLFTINKWVRWFDDAHLRINISHQSKDNLRSIFSTTDTIKLTKKQFQKYTLNSFPKRNHSSMEGVWQNEDASLRVGIVLNKNHYTGFIVTTTSPYWKPKDIRFSIYKHLDGYVADCMFGNHIAVKKYKVNYQKDTLRIGKVLALYRVMPAKNSSLTTVLSPKIPVFKPAELSRLDSKTTLLTLKSFSPTYYKEIDSILTSNLSLLQTTKHLLIDIRMNTGGITNCFEKLLPYIYTNPIVIDGYSRLASTQNIQLYCAISPEAAKTITPKRKKEKEEYEKYMKQYEGQMTPIAKDTLIKFDTIYPFPQRIAILMDEYTGSSAEFFVLRAKQSTKVKTFGQPTIGAADYVEVLTDKNIPSGIFYLDYPMTKMSRRIKDPNAPVRIPPDVLLSEFGTDWVKMVQSYFENTSW